MSENVCSKWEEALTALEHLYRDIEKQTFALPGFTLLPLVVCIWSLIKFEFFVFLDIILLIPMNGLILLRNLFPGRWRYRSFSGRYWKYAITWIWRGEAPTFPVGVIRPFVSFLLRMHIHGRIDILKRYLLLDENVSEEERTRLETKIRRMQELWKRPTAAQVIYSYVLPISGPSIKLYESVFPGSSAPWVSFLAYVLISYSLAFVVSSIMAKRSLMLGASGRAVYFPGAIAGVQSYGKEREILALIGVTKKEFPWDIAIVFISILLGFIFTGQQTRFYTSVGLQTLPEKQLFLTMLIQAGIFLVLSGLVLHRRKVTGRA